MPGLPDNANPPSIYRAWADSIWTFDDAQAEKLREPGILAEPDSREPWFPCEAHDMECIGETLDKIEPGMDITINCSPGRRGERTARALNKTATKSL